MSATEPTKAATVASSEPVAISESAPIAPTKAVPVCVRFTADEHAVLTAYTAEYRLSIPELLRLSWSAMRRAEENAS